MFNASDSQGKTAASGLQHQKGEQDLIQYFGDSMCSLEHSTWMFISVSLSPGPHQ